MRIISVLFLCCLLGGCAGFALPEIPEATAPQALEFTWQSIVLADSQDCFLRVERCALDDQGNYTVELLCQNRSQVPQMFTCQDWCLDGWQVLSFWGQEIGPGQQEAIAVSIPREALEKSGIEAFQSLSFDLRIFSQTDLRQSYLVSSRCELYPTGAKPGQLVSKPLAWQADAMLLADNSQCTMVLTGFHQTQGKYQVDCLLENKTRSPMMLRVYDLAFNGAESDQVWAFRLSPGAKCAVEMELELPATAGRVRKMDMGVHISQSEEWFGRVWVQEAFVIKPPFQKG